MSDASATRAELIDELVRLRARVAQLEGRQTAVSECKRLERVPCGAAAVRASHSHWQGAAPSAAGAEPTAAGHRALANEPPTGSGTGPARESEDLLRRDQITGLTLCITDATERRRMEALRHARCRVLEQMATGQSLQTVLDAVILMIEEQGEEIRGAILLLDEDRRRLRHAAAPNLPAEFTGTVDGLQIGPKAGSFGTAVYCGRRVVVADTQTDPLWESFREVAGRFGLRACWSQPILSSHGETLGALAVYHRAPREPGREELKLVESCAHLAGIAIERKRAEDSLRQREAELAHVSRLTTMGEMVAEIAHEINQPLFAIVNYAQACSRRLQDIDDEKTADLFDWTRRIDRIASSAGDIVERLRDFVRKPDRERAVLDVGEVIRESISLLDWESRRHGIAVRFVPPEPRALSAGNRNQIQQVLVNLLHNAYEAVRGTAQRARSVEVHVTTTARDVQVAVRDTGPGFASPRPERFFKPFVTTKPKGIGMGLAVSRSIVEDHGGKLWAISCPKDSSTLYFTLPRAHRGNDDGNEIDGFRSR